MAGFSFKNEIYRYYVCSGIYFSSFSNIQDLFSNRNSTVTGSAMTMINNFLILTKAGLHGDIVTIFVSTLISRGEWEMDLH